MRSQQLTPFHIPDTEKQEIYRGCLLGGAVGDALGAPVEFFSHDEIVKQFGPEGIQNYWPAYGIIGAITDDTQMTLFTAEGILRAHIRGEIKGICDVPSVVHYAYLRWLYTQGYYSSDDNDLVSGWLIQHPQLHHRRSPGRTCIAALKINRSKGSPANNNSKGCGGVMRVAPVGMYLHSISSNAYGREINYLETFSLASKVSALTHGHPTGQIAAGMMAAIVFDLLDGKNIITAVERAEKHMSRERDATETLKSIATAKHLASTNLSPHQAIHEIGGGWVAEEALAIGIYAALKGDSFQSAVAIAVNHDGDSDSTGLIAGQLCGALYGYKAIPSNWLENLELRSVITDIADDIATVSEWKLDDCFDSKETEYYWNRYPGC